MTSGNSYSHQLEVSKEGTTDKVAIYLVKVEIHTRAIQGLSALLPSIPGFRNPHSIVGLTIA